MAGKNKRRKTPVDEPQIDLTAPTHMAGNTAFLRGLGGGQCKVCQQFFATLMPDGKCAQHSTTPAPECTATGKCRRKEKQS